MMMNNLEMMSAERHDLRNTMFVTCLTLNLKYT